MSIAAVQARIAEISSRFGQQVGPIAVSTNASSPSPTFDQQLAVQRATLGGARDTTPTGTPVAAPALRSSAGTAPAGLGTAGAASLSGASVGERVVALAKQQLGTPYEWGGESPGGFDCSGLLQWAYGQVGIDLPRVSNDQAKAGRAVSAAEARPGDLVFFERGRVDHIGMYAGGGQWVVAPKTGDVVKLQDVDLSKATTIRRITSDAAPAPAAAASAGGSTPYAALFASAGARHGVSPALLSAVARAESGFNASARSSAGAQGLMQLMPATARGLGVDPWKPAEAVDGAARLLKSHLQRFGATELALAAYNAGPGAVVKHGGVPPYKETQAYVAKIMSELRAVAT